ncbi:MAG: metallophosphoesterase [Devosia sp.]
MKLLIVADLHYSLPQFDWVLENAPNYDGVIIAGDLLDIGSPVDLGAQIVVVLKYLKRLRDMTKVFVCSGNHDLDGTGPGGEKQALWMKEVKRLSIPADGDTLYIGDAMITMCAWWDGPATQAEIGAELDAAAADRRGPWIWVYHAPPPESPISWSGQRFYGDQALVGWVARHNPDLVICGHVHEAPFARNGSWVDRIGNTWLFNAGKQTGNVPTTIAIDTEARQAAWFSFEGGAETVYLDQELERPIEQLTEMPAWMPAPKLS